MTAAAAIFLVKLREKLFDLGRDDARERAKVHAETLAVDGKHAFQLVVGSECGDLLFL